MKGYKANTVMGSEVVMDGYVKKKKRCIKELTSGELTEMPEKEQNEREEDKVESVTCMSHGLISVMAACFAKMDQEVSGGGPEDAILKTMGSTAVVVLIGTEEVVVANCGDSRAVLFRGGSAVALSRDHKPDKPDERERVEAAGGSVINWDGNRVLGVLATSRSIGDQYLKPYVISIPEVSVTERTKSDSFVILASDGLWDVVSNETACEVVKRYIDGQIKMRFSDLPQGCNGDRAAEAAAMLAELAMARGSTDNISVIVVELKR
ncbi:hypothetical protein DITRI_Ditri04bG0139800 [Diplodiscus trichospermus]